MNTKTGTSIKKRLFEDMALIGRAVGHQVRLEILDMLEQGERTVEILAEKCGQKTGNISQHLKILAQAGLVEKRRNGNFIVYKNVDEAAPLLEMITGTAARTLPAVKQTIGSYFDSKQELTRYSLTDLARNLRKGNIILLDVRPTDEYDSGHVPGALSVPLKELRNKMKSLPKDKEIIAYCRGPYCVLAVEAVRMLKKQGFNATRTPAGYPQMK